MITQWSVLLNAQVNSLLQIYQTVSNADSTFTIAVPPQTLILPPLPIAATQVEFCNMTTAKAFLLDAGNSVINVWINSDPTIDPPMVVNGFMFVTMDITSIFLQNPGGMTSITARVTVVGI